MGCRFVEGQLVRKARECPMTTKPVISIGTVWTVSEVDDRPWLDPRLPHGEDCWPIRVMLFRFREEHDEWICSCQFDPVGDDVPAIESTRRVPEEVD